MCGLCEMKEKLELFSWEDHMCSDWVLYVKGSKHPCWDVWHVVDMRLEVGEQTHWRLTLRDAHVSQPKHRQCGQILPSETTLGIDYNSSMKSIQPRCRKTSLLVPLWRCPNVTLWISWASFPINTLFWPHSSWFHICRGLCLHHKGNWMSSLMSSSPTLKSLAISIANLASLSGPLMFPCDYLVDIIVMRI